MPQKVPITDQTGIIKLSTVYMSRMYQVPVWLLYLWYIRVRCESRLLYVHVCMIPEATLEAVGDRGFTP